MARENRLDSGAATGCVADGDPVADRGHRAPELVVPQSPARVGEPLVPLAAHEIAAAMLRDDPSGLEAPLGMSCEGRLELVGPAESGQGSIGQREAPSLGWVNQAAARGVRERGLLEDGVEPEGDAAMDFHGSSSRSTEPGQVTGPRAITSTA